MILEAWSNIQAGCAVGERKPCTPVVDYIRLRWHLIRGDAQATP